jgi:hypothetical protein
VTAGRSAPFIRRLRVDNYRSIARCDVPGWRSISGCPSSRWRSRRTTSFELGRDPAGDEQLLVLHEAGEIQLPDGPLTLPLEIEPNQTRLRLGALAVRRSEPLAALESALRTMSFYEMDIATLSALQEHRVKHASPGPAGQRLGLVLGDLANNNKLVKERIDGYLRTLVPGILGVDERREGRYSTIHGRFRAEGHSEEQIFFREELSEGAVRAAGVLAAHFQHSASSGRLPLIGIERPDTALHPAGIGALYEALKDASEHVQVIVTSQSSDLLDSEHAGLDHLRVVAAADGATRIGPVDAAGRAMVEDGLLTIAELHRSGQLRPGALGHPARPAPAMTEHGSHPIQ